MSEALLPFLDECLAAAVPLAARTGERLAGEVKTVDRNQVVTEVDLAIGALLVERIRRYHPADSVIEEETGATAGTSARTWIIDPLDGTSNFAAGSPLYGIMIAVLDGATPVAAGIALPVFGETYLAAAGSGVRLNGRPLERDVPLPLSDHLIAYGLDIGSDEEMRDDWTLLRGLAPRCRGIRMSNSVFDAVQVVRGTYGGFLHRRMKVWDIAPIELVVVESGGRCTDLEGLPVSYAAGDLAERNFTMCASACSTGDALHDAVMAVR